MRLDGARVLVAGATGVLSTAVCTALHGRGARLAVAGRNPHRLAGVTGALTPDGGGPPPSRTFDAYDLSGCGALPSWAAAELGGLDAVLALPGVAGFGAAAETEDAVAEHLFTVNALCPLAVLRAALPLLGRGGVIGAVSGVLVERAQPSMADYGAAKAALSHWLTAVRTEERRRGVQVLDARLPHLDTGFAGRAVAGTPPALPAGVPAGAAADAVVDALADGAGVLGPGPGGGFAIRPR